MYLGEQFKFNENECYRPTRMEINTQFVRENFRDLKKLAGRSEVIAAVKGNAYSHGLVPISKILYEEGCNWFAVAIIEEALLQNAAAPTRRHTRGDKARSAHRALSARLLSLQRVCSWR